MNDEVRIRLHQDGFAMVPDLLCNETLVELRDALEADHARPSEHRGRINPVGEAGAVESDLFAWHRDERVARHVGVGPWPGLAAAALGTDDVVLVEDQWFRAEPGAISGSPWHHDAPYYNIDGAFCVVWVALDDHPAGTGLSLVPGSHRTGLRFTPRHFGTEDEGASGGDPAAEHLAGAVCPSYAAGDAVVFDALTLHSGGPPDGALRRRWSVRYAHPEARYLDRGRDAARFWSIIDHGRTTGDALACDAFPLLRLRS